MSSSLGHPLEWSSRVCIGRFFYFLVHTSIRSSFEHYEYILIYGIIDFYYQSETTYWRWRTGLPTRNKWWYEYTEYGHMGHHTKADWLKISTSVSQWSKIFWLPSFQRCWFRIQKLAPVLRKFTKYFCNKKSFSLLSITENRGFYQHSWLHFNKFMCYTNFGWGNFEKIVLIKLRTLFICIELFNDTRTKKAQTYIFLPPMSIQF